MKKQITLVSLYVLTVLFFIAKTPVANKYEISIYDIYPNTFWLILLCGIFSSIFILLLYSYRSFDSSAWITGFFLLTFINGMIILLPFFRGYLMYGRGDALSHIGHLQDIILTGNLGVDNIYPMVHIILFSFSGILGLTKETSLIIIMVVFLLLYYFNVYLLASVIAKSHEQKLMIIAFSIPMYYSFFHLDIRPAFFGIFMLPLFFYLLHQKDCTNNKFEYTILFLFTMLLITYSHPFISIFLIMFVFSGDVLEYLSYLLQKKDYLRISHIKLVAIMFILFFIWYFSFNSIQNKFAFVYTNLIDGSDDAISVVYMDQISSTKLSYVEIIELIIRRYGSILLLLIMNLACSFYFLKYIGIDWGKSKTYTSYFIYNIFTLTITSFLYFGDFIENNLYRILRFAILISIVFSGLIAFEILNNLSHTKQSAKKSIFFCCLFLILAISSAISMFNVYSSPSVASTNDQVTLTDVAGTKWLYNHGDSKIPIADAHVVLSRYSHYLFGRQTRHYFDRYKGTIPPHIGYNTNSTAIETFGIDGAYLVFNVIDYLIMDNFKENMIPADYLFMYLDSDFIKLYNDSSALKVYSNGEFEIWKIER